jgi:hypothetical protein
MLVLEREKKRKHDEAHHQDIYISSLNGSIPPTKIILTNGCFGIFLLYYFTCFASSRKKPILNFSTQDNRVKSRKKKKTYEKGIKVNE